MEPIKSVVEKFLQEQQERLKQKSYRIYEDVMDSYFIYLNSYGPNYISGELEAAWDKAYEIDEQAFIKIVPASEIPSVGYFEFLDYFVPRKLLYYSDSYLNNCKRVLKKFTKWLLENECIDREKFEELMEDLDM